MNVILINFGSIFISSMRKAVKRQANVPRMMIMKAAGLFNELIGAPLRIMPPKMAISPDNRPISVDFSKKIPLFPNGRDAGLIYIETNAKKIHDSLKDFATIFP